MSILVDYSKAFDTINHKTLLEKLISLNFRNRIIKIIVSYLTNQHQYLQINDQISPKSQVHVGIPQGSILVPILFNIYVAKLPSYIDSDSVQYPDEITVCRTCRPNDILQKTRKLENHIKLVSEWLVENGLVFNNEKLKLFEIKLFFLLFEINIV